MPFYCKQFLSSGALCLFFVAAPALAEDVTAALPSEIRTLLQQEMLEIDAAMKDIHGAIVRGEHEVVAAKGQAIHDSFILKKSMTPEKRRILKATLPQAFLELDQEFHELAAGLAVSGNRRDVADQMRIFAQMTQACVICHSRHVGERFGGLDAY